MPFIKYKNNIIEIKMDRMTGEENVFYNKDIVSSKTSMFGATHKFSVQEEGENVNYEIKVKVRGGLFGKITGIGMALPPIVEVYRNDKKIHP